MARASWRSRVVVLSVAASLTACGDSTGPGQSDRDTVAPVVVLTSPVAGVLSSVVAVPATASDDRGVYGVDFYVNGGLLAARDLVAPYTVSWNTDAIAGGTYTLWAVAFDASGNSTTSAEVVMTKAD